MTSRRNFLRAMAGSGVTGLAGLTGAQKALGDRPEQTLAQQSGQNCTLPVFTDEYIGFRVGRPAGWSIQYSGGIIWQAPPAQSTSPDLLTLAFVYPGFLRGTDIQTVAREFVAALNEALSPQGTLALTSGNALTGSNGSTPLRGRIWTETRESLGLVWGGFGTAAAWPGNRRAVAAMGPCFERFPGATLRIETVSTRDSFGSTTWQYAVPNGWEAFTANSVGIDIVGEQSEGVSRGHVGFGFYSGVTQSDPVTAIRQWLWLLDQQGIDIQLLNAWDLGTTHDPLGYPWQTVAVEFERTSTAPATPPPNYRGVLTTSVASGATGYGTGWSTTMQWVREAITTDWERLAAIMGVIESNIVIVSRQPGQGISTASSIAQTNSEISDIVMDTWEAQNEVDDRLQEQYVDAIWEVDRVENPSDPDDQVLVPISSFDPATCTEDERPVYNSATGTTECWPLVG